MTAERLGEEARLARPAATREPDPAAVVFNELHRRWAAAPTLIRALQEAFHDYFGQSGYATREELDLLAAAGRLGAASRALDLGCGSGGPTLRLATRTGCRMIGMDAAPAAIEQARARVQTQNPSNRLRFIEGHQGKPLPFGRGGFDAVISVDGLYWPRQKNDLFRECRRVLRRDGRLALLAIYVAQYPPDPRLDELDPYDAGRPYPELLAEAGFAEVEMLDLTPPFIQTAAAVATSTARHLPALQAELGASVADAMHRRFALTSELAAAGDLRRALFSASAH